MYELRKDNPLPFFKTLCLHLLENRCYRLICWNNTRNTIWHKTVVKNIQINCVCYKWWSFNVVLLCSAHLAQLYWAILSEIQSSKVLQWYPIYDLSGRQMISGVPLMPVVFSLRCSRGTQMRIVISLGLFTLSYFDTSEQLPAGTLGDCLNTCLKCRCLSPHPIVSGFLGPG